MQDLRYRVRQKFDLGDEGNRAVVSRILKLNHQLFVEVSQTKDATEPTVMRVIHAALDDYQKQHDQEIVDG